MTGNKGEWSEIYVLFRLLADGRIYAADENVERIVNIYFPILKIIRDEVENNHCEYLVGDNKVIEIYVNGEKKKTLNSDVFKTEADDLLNRIIESKGTFEIVKSEQFMQSIYCKTLKVTGNDKTDILMQIHDIHTGYEPFCGFSIKSELGSPPTLLNSSKSTNFIFRIDSLSKNDADAINNAINMTRHQRFCEIENRGGIISFDRIQGEIFTNNLILIDSLMPQILSCAVLYRIRKNVSSICDIVDALETENPLKFPRNECYRYKIKKFLCSVALGMKSATLWDGIDEANGGYIIVSRKGDVLAFYIYNRNSFESYLLNNTNFVDSSAGRNDFGKIYSNEDGMFINLNPQVRFKK